MDCLLLSVLRVIVLIVFAVRCKPNPVEGGAIKQEDGSMERPLIAAAEHKDDEKDDKKEEEATCSVETLDLVLGVFVLIAAGKCLARLVQGISTGITTITLT